MSETLYFVHSVTVPMLRACMALRTNSEYYTRTPNHIQNTMKCKFSVSQHANKNVWLTEIGSIQLKCPLRYSNYCNGVDKSSKFYLVLLT